MLIGSRFLSGLTGWDRDAGTGGECAHRFGERQPLFFHQELKRIAVRSASVAVIVIRIYTETGSVLRMERTKTFVCPGSFCERNCLSNEIGKVNALQDGVNYVLWDHRPEGSR